MGLAVGLTIPILLGNIILYFLDSKKILKPVENLALSFMLGYAGITLLLFWSFFINLPYRVSIIGGAIAASFVLKSIFRNNFGYAKNLLLQLKHHLVRIRGSQFLNFRNILLILLSILIIFKLSYAFIETCSKPEYSWDASAFWTMDGKYFFYLNQEVPDQIFRFYLMFNNYHPDYPKQIPLMHFWLFSWMGEANDQWSKIFFPISLGCFLVLFYISLRKTTGKLGAGFITYFLLSSPFFLYDSTIGYADFTRTVYFSLGVIFFYRWIHEKQDLYFWLFAFFSSLTTWIKHEGKALYLVGLIILLIHVWNYHNRSVKAVLTKAVQYLSIYVVIGLPWQLFIISNHLETREKLGSYLSHFFELHSQIYTKLFIEGSWGIFWIAVVAVVIFFYKSLFKEENAYLVLTFLLLYGVALFIYQFTDDGYGMFSTSFNRIWLSAYPITVFMLGCIIPKINHSILGDI